MNRCVVYFPTPWFLDFCLREAYEAHCNHEAFGTTIQYKRDIPNNAKSQISWAMANMKQMRTVINLRLHGKYNIFQLIKDYIYLSYNMFYVFSDLHPKITKRRNKETNELELMSIFSYLKIHAQRENACNIRPINKTKYNKSPESKFMTKISRTAVFDKNTTVISSNKRTGTGYFFRVVCSGDKVQCNCENYRRSGLCNHVELFKIMSFLTVPNPSLQDWLTKDGITDIRSKLIAKLSPHILEEKTYFSDFLNDTAPPRCDPMHVLSSFRQSHTLDS